MEVIISDIAKANEILAEYKGAKVELWSFDRFHEKIQLLINFSDNESVIFLTLISSTYFSGSLYWLDSELRITEHEGSDGWDIARITDLRTGYYIEFSREFVLKKGSEDDFLKEFGPDLS
ncbi:hypothetical protein [Aquimarina sp. Aq78]|uniref:hypothetical protein n=1 Tax=Aquimarina sp. Aq78 TaxID=1191889 RepID=UPI000D0F6372|nr:hypothetical protein [Aquimarina sp. Aq78]